MTTADVMFRVTAVLTGTDGSPAARTAVEWGAALAADRSVPMTIVHAIDVLPPTRLSPEVQDAADALAAAAATAAEAHGVTAEVVVEQGHAWELLSQRAQPSDLIVIGARGDGIFTRHGLGRIADRIVRHAPCPVLAVPDTGCPEPGRVGAVVVGIDFSPNARRALHVAAGLLVTGGALVAVHALPPAPAIMDAPMSGVAPVDIVPAMRDAEAELDRWLEPYAAAGLETHGEVRASHAVHAIEEVAATIRADMVVVGTHGRTGLTRLLLGSVAERVLHHVPCATLVVPDHAAAAGG